MLIFGAGILCILVIGHAISWCALVEIMTNVLIGLCNCFEIHLVSIDFVEARLFCDAVAQPCLLAHRKPCTSPRVVSYTDQFYALLRNAYTAEKFILC